MSTPNDKRHQTFAQRAAPKLQAAVDAMAAAQPSPAAVEQAARASATQQGQAQACIEQAARLIVEGKDPNGAVLNLNEALARIDALQAQRDELLAVCKSIAEVADSAMWDKAFGAETVARFMAKSVDVRAAIARATEGGTGQ